MSAPQFRVQTGWDARCDRGELYLFLVNCLNDDPGAPRPRKLPNATGNTAVIG